MHQGILHTDRQTVRADCEILGDDSAKTRSAIYYDPDSADDIDDDDPDEDLDI